MKTFAYKGAFYFTLVENYVVHGKNVCFIPF